MKRFFNTAICLMALMCSVAIAEPYHVTLVYECNVAKAFADTLLSPLQRNLGISVKVQGERVDQNDRKRGHLILALKCDATESSSPSEIDKNGQLARIHLSTLGLTEANVAEKDSIPRGRSIGVCTAAVAKLMGLETCPNPRCALSKHLEYAGSTLCPPCSGKVWALPRLSIPDKSQPEK